MRALATLLLLGAIAVAGSPSVAAVRSWCGDSHSQYHDFADELGPVALFGVQRVDFSSLSLGPIKNTWVVGPIAIQVGDQPLQVLDSVGAVPPGSGRMVGYEGLSTAPVGFDILDPVSFVALLMVDLQSSALLTVELADGSEMAFPVAVGSASGKWKWLYLAGDDDDLVAARCKPDSADDYAVAEVVIGHHTPEPGCAALLAVGLAVRLCSRRRSTRSK